MDQNIKKSFQLNSSLLSLSDLPLKHPFLSNVTRFSNPPPLSKFINPSFYVPSDPINESFNSKGCNSFVSKSQRFPEQIKNTGPGPGSYYQPGTILNKKLRNSPIFHKRDSKNRFTQPAIVPGPGVYNFKREKRNIPAGKFVFSSKVLRFGMKIFENPPPGNYMIKREFEEKKNKGKISSFFLEPKIENQTIKHERFLIDEIKKFQDPCLQKISEGKKNRILQMKGRIFMKKNKGLMKRTKDNGPGPGAYIKIKTDLMKCAVSGAVFKSESERGEKNGERFDNLGPGSYKSLGTVKRKNFNYNMKQSWV